jgi:hypothetical protein
LIALAATGSAAINDNGVLAGLAAVVVIGLIVHIIANKQIAD